MCKEGVRLYVCVLVCAYVCLFVIVIIVLNRNSFAISFFMLSYLS